LFKDANFLIGRRFATGALAVQWADQERLALGNEEP